LSYCLLLSLARKHPIADDCRFGLNVELRCRDKIAAELDGGSRRIPKHGSKLKPSITPRWIPVDRRGMRCCCNPTLR
jgi:hypothetical protein